MSWHRVSDHGQPPIGAVVRNPYSLANGKSGYVMTEDHGEIPGDHVWAVVDLPADDDIAPPPPKPVDEDLDALAAKLWAAAGNDGWNNLGIASKQRERWRNVARVARDHYTTLRPRSLDLLDAAHETMRLVAEWVAEPEPKGERPNIVEAILRSMMAEIEVGAR